MSAWPREWLSTTPGATCPRCDTPTGRPVLYGYPSPGLIAAHEAGDIDVVLGGCMVMGDDPAYLCRTCGMGFGQRPRDRPAPLSGED